MITEIKVENYKSLHDFTMEVGRFNVLIGENGCGKSNILEAITLAGAAEADRLDKEFLNNRGVRVTEPELMRSAFNHNRNAINILIKVSHSIAVYDLYHDDKAYSEWHREIVGLKPQHVTSIKDMKIKLGKYNNKLRLLEKFIIFSPENTTLRDFSKEANIEPLGDKGEGLLKLLIITQHEAKESQDFSVLNDIKEVLELFGWFEAIKIPNDFSLLDKKIMLTDSYLEMPFDQRSANEGFLLVLFYVTLMVSKYTPKIFAIDNIDTALNPKLCSKLITELTRLAKKYDKQVFVTTHNPAILDGIDLGDDEQRLLVISRNRKGHTRCKRIGLENKPKSSIRERLARVLNEENAYTKEDVLNKFDNSKEPVKLSEAFLRNYLGGLPEKF